MEQRVIHDGMPMARYVALQMAAAGTRRWDALDVAIKAKHEPIDEPDPVAALREAFQQERAQATLALSLL